MDDASEALAVVAHELRTPVAAMMTTVSLLVSEYDGLDRQEASCLLRRLQRSTAWLQGLIDNLTSSAALESGSVHLRREVVSVQACVDEVLPFVQPLLERRGQAIRIAPAAATTDLYVDPQRVGQVLANLIVNASRYSVAGDVIEIDVADAGGWVDLRVVDHGPGVPSAERERIFGRRVRGTQAGGVGLGLGLSIVRDLVELHGGAVGVEDTPYGGASFRLTLPRAALHAPAQPDQAPAWPPASAELWRRATA